MTTDDAEAVRALEFSLLTILPEEYRATYDALEPVPMKSAGLKYGPDGQVAWGEIWQSFCDLAMAGGPPHKGSLLGPGAPSSVDARPQEHAAVVEEICRGVTLATDLPASISPNPGWVRVTCYSETMAGWLLRAIVMENVAARREGLGLDLPASPAFRLEKEIKNVVTVIAKTSHYWLGHIPRTQKAAIASLFASLDETSPLVEPEAWSDPAPTVAHRDFVARVTSDIARATGLSGAAPTSIGWFGLQCPSVRAAVWLMRAAVASNVLARREETVLLLPVNPTSDSDGDAIVATTTRLHRLARAKGIL